MGLFTRQKTQTIIIVGCGRLGSTLANQLSEQNKNVSIIDINESSFRKLSQSYGGFQIEGDGSDLDMLLSAGAEDADILISTTNDDDTNIMIAQIGKELFDIDYVIARLQDTSKKVVISGMDIHTICPADLSIKEFSRIIGERTDKSDEDIACRGSSEDQLPD